MATWGSVRAVPKRKRLTAADIREMNQRQMWKRTPKEPQRGHKDHSLTEAEKIARVRVAAMDKRLFDVTV
jgi:hypothetical protein